LAFVSCELREQFSDLSPEGFLGTLGGLSEQVFEFGEDLFDGVEVRAVGGQKPERRSCGTNGSTDCGGLVAAEGVQNDDIAGLQGGNPYFLDLDAQDVGVDRAVKDPGCVDAVMAQGGEEGHGIPMSERGFGLHAGTAPAPATQEGHIGLGPGLIDEDKAAGVNLPLIVPAPHPPACVPHRAGPVHWPARFF
jgi:hypothetical protein